MKKLLILIMMIGLVPLAFAGEDIIVNGDHSTNPDDYFFWDNGDEFKFGATRTAPADGDALTTQGWTTGSTSHLYTSAKEKLGNMSIDMFRDGADREAIFDFGSEQTNITFQVTLFDDKADTAGHTFLWGRADAAAMIFEMGPYTGISATKYYYSVSGSSNNMGSVAREDGGINFTIHVSPSGSYMAMYFNRTLIVNDTSSDGFRSLKITQYASQDMDTQLDDLMIWSGSPEDRPVSPPPPPDSAAPVIQISVNDSTPQFNELINISFNVTDDTAPTFVNVTINFTSGLVILNHSVSVDADLHNITLITDRSSNVLNISVCAVDAEDNYACNSTKITVDDTVNPFADSKSINITDPRINEDVQFGINATDTDSISSIFFAHNISGTMTNITSINLTGIQTELNFTVNITNTLTKRNVVLGIFTVNDSGGNSIQTSLNYTVGDTINPTITLVAITSVIPILSSVNQINISATDDKGISSIWIANDASGSFQNISSVNFTDIVTSITWDFNHTVAETQKVQFRFTINDTSGNSVQNDLFFRKAPIRNETCSNTNDWAVTGTATVDDGGNGLCEWSGAQANGMGYVHQLLNLSDKKDFTLEIYKYNADTYDGGWYLTYNSKNTTPAAVNEDRLEIRGSGGPGQRLTMQNVGVSLTDYTITSDEGTDHNLKIRFLTNNTVTVLVDEIDIGNFPLEPGQDNSSFLILKSDTATNNSMDGFALYELVSLAYTANASSITPEIILPINNDFNNTQPNYPFNITYDGTGFTGDVTISYYINGVLNQTSLTNTTFNASDGFFILNVSLDDGTIFGPNVTVNFTIDTSVPTLVLFNMTNNTIFGPDENMTANITMQDQNPFNLSFNLHNSSNEQIEFGYNDVPNSSTTIMIVREFNLTGLASGNYTLDINFSDRHTKTRIKAYEYETVEKGFEFNTEEGSQITITQVSGTDDKVLRTQKKIDRYTIEYGTKSKRETKQFRVTANKDIKILWNTDYKGHLIIGKNWMDFENGDKGSIVTVKREGKRSVLVTVYSNNFNFQSLGGLHVVDVFYPLQVDNDPPYFENLKIHNTLPLVNTEVNLSVDCLDVVGISTCIISHNESGTWVNATSKTASSQITNLSHHLALAVSTEGATIGAMACANDTVNVFSCSDIITLQVNDTALPIIISGINATRYIVNQSINVTYNVTDNLLLTSGQIVITEDDVKKFLNFTLTGISGQFSEVFNISTAAGNVINITGIVNDSFSNLVQTETIISVTKDLVVTAFNVHGNNTVQEFEVSIFNSTFAASQSTTNGSIFFPDIVNGLYDFNISSDAEGGYLNRTILDYNITDNLNVGIFHSIVYVTAVRRGTSDSVIQFNVSLPQATNSSNSTGGLRLLLNGSDYVVSIISEDFFNTTNNISIDNQTVSRHVMELYDINLSIELFSIANNSAINNFTVFLSGHNSEFTENATAENGNATFSLGNNTYDVRIVSEGFATFVQSFFIGSNDTFPNLTFSLAGVNSINFSVFDEITEELITDNDTTISMISEEFAINDSSTDNGRLYIQDLQLGDYRITYEHPQYTKRDFYLTVSNSSNQSADLYLLSINNGTEVEFTVQDNNGNELSNSTIRLKRYYLSTNSYRTVAMSRTNEEGKTQIDVDFNDAFYETLTTFEEFSLRTIGAKIISFTRILTLNLIQDPFLGTDNLNDLITSISFNNDTETFSYVFTQKSGRNVIGTLEVVSSTGGATDTVCTATDTTSSGTLLCQVNTTNATGTYTAKGFVKDGNNNVLTNSLSVITGITNQLREKIGQQGFFFAILISGTLAGLGSIVSPAVAVVMFLVGIFVSNFLGFSIIAASGLGLLIITTMVIVWRMRR